MKNKTVNKKVLRAMSIGLAAMMTVQPILATPVFADDTEPVDDSNTTTYDEENHESETTNEAREAVDTASNSANTVVNDVEAIKTDIPVIDQETGKVLNQANLVPEALEKVSDTLEVVDADLTIVENYLTDDNVSKITGSGFDEAYKANVQAYVAAVAVYGEEGPKEPNENDPNYEAAKKAYDDFQALKAEIDERLKKEEDHWNTKNVLKPAIGNVTSDGFVSETKANSNIATAVGEANKAVEGAAEEQKNANAAGEEAAELIGNTEEQFIDYVNEIKNAATIDAANESYDKLVEMLNDAKTTLEEKQKVYDAAAKAYEDYQTEYANQEKAIEDAKNAYQAAKDIYDKAAGNYADWSVKHTQKVDDLTIYHNTLADAEAKYNEAVKKLAEIKDQADNIAAAAAAAKNSILANGGNKILTAIEVTEKSNSRVWSEQDKLFEEIVKNYLLEGKDAKLEWKRISEDMCNYCVVTYKDEDGNEQTLVLDYVMTNQDGSLKVTEDEKPGKLNGNSASKIVIFEKSEDERKAADALDKDKNALLYDKDINVDKYKVINEKGQPVYLDKSYVEGELDKDNGSIINVGGVYYQKGTATPDVKLTYGENGLVSDTTNEDESERTVITVNKNTVKAEDFKLVDGKLVQEYKGATTTIEYHKALSQSGYVCASEYDANVALDKAKEVVGKDDILIDGEITRETKTEYTTSGTYIPIFQEKITIEKTEYDVSDKHLGFIDGNQEDALNAAKEDIAGWYDDYYVIDSTFNLSAQQAKETKPVFVGFEKGKWGIPNPSKPIYEDKEVNKDGHYNVSGTATFTYVSKTLVTKEKASEWLGQDVYSTIAGWFGGNVPSSAEIQNMVAEKLKKEGKILVSWNVPDGNWGKASYAYINKASVAVSGDACASKELAEESFEKALAAAVNNSEYKGRTENAQLLKGTYTDLLGNEIDLVNSATVSQNVTKYGYKLSYWDQRESKTTENTLIKTETSDASKVYGVVVQNQDGDIVLNQVTDKNFNEFIEKVKAQNERFKTLEEDALKAKADVEAAQTKVNELKGAIDKIKETNVKQVNKLKPLVLLDGVDFSNYELKDLEKFLEKAQGQLDDAKARLAKLNEQLADAKEARDNRITALTPAPAPAPTTGGGETTPAGGGTTTAPISTLATALAGAPTFALPTGGVAAPAAGVAGARTSRGAAIDADSSAAGTEDTTAKIAPTKEVEEDALAITKDTIKTIKDNETPLSSLTEDSTKKMNWWWLLLIALLGATGEEIYRRNKKKKEEEAALKAEVDKNN